jgi:hypothetical protein
MHTQEFYFSFRHLTLSRFLLYRSQYSPLPPGEDGCSREDVRQDEALKNEEKACSEHDTCKDEGLCEVGQTFIDAQLKQNRRRLWLRVSIGVIMTISIFCMLYAISSLTESSNTSMKDIKFSLPNNTSTSTNMKLQIIISSFVGSPSVFSVIR